eukprot:689371-Rhodomonas_salina.1
MPQRDISDVCGTNVTVWVGCGSGVAVVWCMERMALCRDCLAVTSAGYAVPNSAGVDLKRFLQNDQETMWKQWWDRYKGNATVVAAIGRGVISFMEDQKWTEDARLTVERFFESLKSPNYKSQRLADAYSWWKTAHASQAAGVVASYGL